MQWISECYLKLPTYTVTEIIVKLLVQEISECDMKLPTYTDTEIIVNITRARGI